MYGKIVKYSLVNVAQLEEKCPNTGKWTVLICQNKNLCIIIISVTDKNVNKKLFIVVFITVRFIYYKLVLLVVCVR